MSGELLLLLTISVTVLFILLIYQKQYEKYLFKSSIILSVPFVVDAVMAPVVWQRGAFDESLNQLTGILLPVLTWLMLAYLLCGTAKLITKEWKTARLLFLKFIVLFFLVWVTFAFANLFVHSFGQPETLDLVPVVSIKLK